MKQTMFYGASKIIFERAKVLRNNVTAEEMVLWEYLRANPFGYKFRRQHPLAIFIADFYCHKLKLVIELDGSIHNLNKVKLHDEARQKIIEAQGLRVIRFRNKEIMNEKEKVIEKINIILNGN
jgi:cyclase